MANELINVRNLRSILAFISAVAKYSRKSRDYFREIIPMLLAFVVEPIDNHLKGDIFITLSHLVKLRSSSVLVQSLFAENDILEVISSLNEITSATHHLNSAIAQTLNSLIAYEMPSEIGRFFNFLIQTILLKSYAK